MSSNVSAVYLHVIDDVLSHVRDEFITSGAGEAVLVELQAIWEAKLMQLGALSASSQRSMLPRLAGAMPVHDLNMPYEGPLEEYETPTAEMLFPPTPVQTPLPGIPEHHMYQIPISGEFAPVSDGRDATDAKCGKPSPYMLPPSPWMNQHPLGVDVNIAYADARENMHGRASHQSLTQDFFIPSAAGKRKRDVFTPHYTEGYIPQQDGADDSTAEVMSPEANRRNPSSRSRDDSLSFQPLPFYDNVSNHNLPALEGSHDDYGHSSHSQTVAAEDYSTPFEHDEFRAPTPLVGTSRTVKTENADDEEPPLNEDDDDLEDLDDLEQGEDQHTQHLVLAQFEKVSRTKSKWKCTLKDGIMHLNGRDVLFNKASGEFDF